MKLLKVLFVPVLLMFFVACSDDSDADGGNSNTVRTADDVRNDFQNLAISPGVNDVRLESLQKGVFWSFRVIAPANASASNERPLVIALHGASGGSTTAHLNTECYVEPGLAALDAFIISPNAGVGEWYDPANQQQVIALTDLATNYWDVNADKIMVMGYSNGGNASWFYAEYFSDFFSASIPMASSYNPAKADGTVPRIDVPMYVIHGSNDELFPVDETSTFVAQSKEAGSTIEFVVADGLTHFKPCDYVDHLKVGVDWVLAEVWNF